MTASSLSTFTPDWRLYTCSFCVFMESQYRYNSRIFHTNLEEARKLKNWRASSCEYRLIELRGPGSTGSNLPRWLLLWIKACTEVHKVIVSPENCSNLYHYTDCKIKLRNQSPRIETISAYPNNYYSLNSPGLVPWYKWNANVQTGNIVLFTHL